MCSPATIASLIEFSSGFIFDNIVSNLEGEISNTVGENVFIAANTISS